MLGVISLGHLRRLQLRQRQNGSDGFQIEIDETKRLAASLISTRQALNC